MNKVLKWRKVYLVVLLLGNLAGILLSIFNVDRPVIQSLSYFTIQSNILVFVFFSYLLFSKKQSKVIQNFKGAVTVAIMITFIVFHVLLSPAMEQRPEFWMNFFVHTYTPLMVLLDYFLFDPKGKLAYKTIPFWLIIPFAYFIYANIYALAGGTFTYEESVSRYPYFFMNPDKIGWGWVVFYVLGITVSISGLSFGFVYLDQLIIREKKPR